MLGKALGSVFLKSHKPSGQAARDEHQMIDGGKAPLMEELSMEAMRESETALLQLWWDTKQTSSVSDKSVKGTTEEEFHHGWSELSSALTETKSRQLDIAYHLMW